jgi:hypothetical protein
MSRAEVARLVADISLAIESSDLLSLLRETDDPERQNGSLRRQQHQKRCMSEIPQSILDDRVEPIRTALENIDAQKLLDLEILQEEEEDHHEHQHQHHRQQQQSPHSQEKAARGPRVRDG